MSNELVSSSFKKRFMRPERRLFGTTDDNNALDRDKSLSTHLGSAHDFNGLRW